MDDPPARSEQMLRGDVGQMDAAAGLNYLWVEADVRDGGRLVERLVPQTAGLVKVAPQLCESHSHDLALALALAQVPVSVPGGHGHSFHSKMSQTGDNQRTMLIMAPRKLMRMETKTMTFLAA